MQSSTKPLSTWKRQFQQNISASENVYQIDILCKLLNTIYLKRKNLKLENKAESK